MNTTIQTIGIIAVAITALVGLLGSMRGLRDTGKKLDVIHVLVDGNLSEIQNDLRKALAEIDTLHANMRHDHQGAGGQQDAPTSSQAAALAGSPATDAAHDAARAMDYPGRVDVASRPDADAAPRGRPVDTDEQGYLGEMIDGNIYTRPDAKG